MLDAARTRRDASFLHQLRDSEAPVYVLSRIRHVATTEPDSHVSVFHQHRGVAQGLGIPELAAANRLPDFLPVDPVAGSRHAEPPYFAAIPAGVQHPVSAVRFPHGRLA